MLLKRLVFYVRPYWKRFVLGLISMTMVAALTTASMYILKEVIDKILIDKNIVMLYIVTGIMISIYLIKGFFSYGQTYFTTYVAQRVIYDIRNQLYEKLQDLSLDFYSRHSTGKIMAHLTNDVQIIQAGVVKIPARIIRDGLTVLFLLGLLFYLHWKFTLILMVIFPVATYFIYKFGKKLRKIGHARQAKMADIYNILQEVVSGIKVVKAFSMEKYEQERFREQNYNFFRTFMHSTQVEAISSPVMEVIAVVAVAFILGYGGREVIKGVWSAGEFFAFLGATLSIYAPFKSFSEINNIIQQSFAAAERVFSIIDEEPKVKEDPNASILPPLEREIEYRCVSFYYQSEDAVLKDIDIKIRKGQVIALAGPSGGGKTTLVNLLMRFYDPVKGIISIDGKDISKVKMDSLRAQIGVVTQENILFNDSVKNNIAYGRKDIPLDRIIEASRAANAHEFILKLPYKYETVIGERGVILSGGERQRIAIARALLKDPDILILDEATSALDTEAEALVQDALNRLMKDRTVLVIAHRLSTIKQADQIIVLDEGRIVERGKHEELLDKKGLYKRLYEILLK